MTTHSSRVKFSDYLALIVLYERYLSGDDDGFPMEWEIIGIIEILKECFAHEDGEEYYNYLIEHLQDPEQGRSWLEKIYSTIFKNISVRVIAIPDLVGKYKEIKDRKPLTLDDMKTIYEFAKTLNKETAVQKFLDDKIEFVENANSEVRETLEKQLRDIFAKEQRGKLENDPTDETILWLKEQMGEST